MRFIENIKNKVWHTMSTNTREAEPYFVVLGYLFIIGYIGFYFFNQVLLVPNGYENFTLRAVISFFGLFLILHKYWPKSLTNLYPIIFYIICFISFPFFFILMMLYNQDSNIWHLNSFFGLLFLALFVDWVSFVILSFAAIILAALITGVKIYDSKFLTAFISYSIPLAYFFIFSQKRQLLQKEKERCNNLEEKVKERTEKLQKALSSKTEFLSNISHEVRTPVHGFTSISEGLVDSWNILDEEKKFNYIKTIATNAKRLEVLINSLLDLSKFNADKMKMEFKEVDLNKIIKEIINECNALYIRDKNINITYDYNQEILLIADQERISQVLRNLFVNAIKFTPDGGKITAIIEKNDQEVCFSIVDSGMGIPEDELSEIFEPFTQSSRTKNKAGGTGLGLSISKEIIKAHYGKIEAKNNNPNGAIFSFTLPITHHKIGKKTVKNKETDQINILMIDDDEACLSGVEILLHNTNYHVTQAIGGEAGINYIKHNPNIDIILMDLMMSGTDGISAIEKIKKDPDLMHIPIILQSGTSNENEIKKAYSLGISSHLKKPYSKAALIAELSKLCE